MRPILQIALFLIVAASPAQAVNPTIPITRIEAQTGFTDVSAIQGQIAGITVFSVSIDPKVFLSQCNYRGAFGTPSTFSVSLCATNDESFQGVTAQLGEFDVNQAAYRVSFQVPTKQLARYRLEFQGMTLSDGSIPRFGNGCYTADLQSIRAAPSAFTEADIPAVIESLSKPGFGGGSDQNRRAEQAGTEQPATRPESKTEDSNKPQPEAEGRSR
jgi:hypothetical protein